MPAVYRGETTIWRDPEEVSTASASVWSRPSSRSRPSPPPGGLLSEYKLEYPQDYAPDGIRSMNDEVEQLHQLRTRLMDLQAVGEQGPRLR